VAGWQAGRVDWSPRTSDTAASLVLGGVFAVGLLAVVDAPGRILLALGALLLLAQGVRDLLLRPRLRARPEGVEVRTPGGRRHLPWPLLRVRVRETRRFGLRSRTLELDTAAGPDDEGVLVVLGRRELGADPEVVADRLRELDPRST
jgi:hypothetical protein